MVSHMKTTVHISDALLEEAQRLATHEGTTLKALINEGLQKIVRERTRSKVFKLRDCSVGGQGLHPDFKDASWEAIRDMIYEGR
jgi:Bacterial antitoxin of type II TA system, VapB